MESSTAAVLHYDEDYSLLKAIEDFNRPKDRSFIQRPNLLATQEQIETEKLKVNEVAQRYSSMLLKRQHIVQFDECICKSRKDECRRCELRKRDEAFIEFYDNKALDCSLAEVNQYFKSSHGRQVVEDIKAKAKIRDTCVNRERVRESLEDVEEILLSSSASDSTTSDEEYIPPSGVRDPTRPVSDDGYLRPLSRSEQLAHNAAVDALQALKQKSPQVSVEISARQQFMKRYLLGNNNSGGANNNKRQRKHHPLL